MICEGILACFPNASWHLCVPYEGVLACFVNGVLDVLEACLLQRRLGVLFECVLKSVRAIRRRLGGLGSLLSAKVSWRVL